MKGGRFRLLNVELDRRLDRNGSGAASSALALGAPVFAAGTLSFTLPTVVGTTYEVQFKPALTGVAWNVRETIVGDGATKTVTIASDGAAGFVRVAAQP